MDVLEAAEVLEGGVEVVNRREGEFVVERSAHRKTPSGEGEEIERETGSADLWRKETEN